MPSRAPQEATTREVAEALRQLVAKLRADQARWLPEGEPVLDSRSGLKRRLKAIMFRATRPATRRYDRLTADLATVAADLAARLAEAEEEMKKARGDYERLELALRALTPTGTTSTESAVWSEIPDEYYWAFEQRMRGSSESVRGAPPWLRGPGPPALRGREEYRSRRPPSVGRPRMRPGRVLRSPPRVGLGRGGRRRLARCRRGVPRARDRRDARGRPRLPRGRPDDPVGGVSAIQLIEHLPRRAWVHLFEEIHRALGPGGALLLETINGQNPDAIADYFVADVTHTWPGHPETLRLMAEHAGFREVEVRFLHEDHRGRAQDVAIWAVKAAS